MIAPHTLNSPLRGVGVPLHHLDRSPFSGQVLLLYVVGYLP